MNPLLRSTSFAPLFVALGLGLAPPVIAPPAAAPTAHPAFSGQDRFDDISTVEELRELEGEIVRVVERVRPSVVFLRGDRDSGGMGSATAVIISKDGLLATCGHVGRSPGRNVTALLTDGTELHGRTLGQCLDDDVDCGLVQLDVEGRELPAAAVGTTVGLAKGDWLIALGYTHGLPDTKRPSLVRVGRVLRINDKGLFLDAPIDAGDSGGPSFNLRGEVVGLNARCGRESWQNLATPIDLLNQRMETLRGQTEPTNGSPSETTNGPPNGPPDASAAPPRRASRFPSENGDDGKFAVERTVPLQDVAARAEAAMVRVYCDDKPVAFGLVVDASGLVVTKASQLEPGKQIAVETASHARHNADEVARDQTTDVALLRFVVALPKADTDERLEPVQWDTDASVAPGAVLITPRDFGERPGLGFAAIERRESETDLIDGPFLGVQTRPASRAELDRADVDRAVTVVRVVSGGAAERAGLAVGDIVISLDGTELDSPNELRRLLGRHQVGDQIRIETVSADGAVSRDIALGRRGDAQDMRRGNTATPISRRSSGLGWLLAHDTVTEPEEMGGPVVDSAGRVVGMNIARYDRTATHAIPASRMAETCRRLMEQSRQAGEAGTPAPASIPSK